VCADTGDVDAAVAQFLQAAWVFSKLGAAAPAGGCQAELGLLLLDSGDLVNAGTSLRAAAELLANALDESGSVARGVLSDVGGGALEIAPSGLGPDYFSSHRAIHRSASSCGSVRPASTSWRPRPMHWRT